MSKITIDLRGIKRWLIDLKDDYIDDWKRQPSESLLDHAMLLGIAILIIRS